MNKIKKLKTKNSGFFAKIRGFFSSIFRRRANSRLIALRSRFSQFLETLDRNSEEYEAANQVIMLCDESLTVIRQRLISIEKLKLLDDQMKELESFNQMGEEDAKQLTDLLDRFVALNKDKNMLKYQITDFDSSLVKMKDLEDEAPVAIQEIKEAESKQRIFKQDLDYLQGEKMELEYQRETLENGIDFVYKFTIGMVIVFGIVATVLVMLYMFKEVSIFMPLTVITILVIVISALLFALRRRMTYELQLNIKKQKRAVEMINTKGAVYAHYTNFLTYEYKKFKVRNSDMLKSNLKDYGNYKYLTKRFDSIRNIMYQTEKEIEMLLRKHNITNVSTSLDNFAKTVNIEDKKDYYRNLLGQKKSIEKELSEYDKRQEQIWDLLVTLNEKDKTHEKVIDSIIQNYMQQVADIINGSIKPIGDGLDLDISDKEALAEQLIEERISGKKKYAFADVN